MAADDQDDVAADLAKVMDAAEAADADDTPEEPAAEAPQPADQAADEAEDVSRETSEPEAEAAPAVEAPQHWSDEDRELFAALPDDATRQKVLDWRKQVERGAQIRFDEAADAVQLRREMDRIFAPLDQQLAFHGVSRLDVIGRMVAAEQMLQTDPARVLPQLVEHYGRPLAGSSQAQEVVRQIARAVGVDPGALQTGQAEEWLDPLAGREIAALKAEITQLRQEQQQWAQSAQTAQAGSLQQQIGDFARATDERGQLKHPHFEAVKQVMGGLLQVGSASTLDEAYDQAVRAHPELWRTLLSQREAARASEAEKARKAAVEKAKKASQPRSRNGAFAAKEPPKTTREELEEAYDRSVGAA